MGGWRAVAVGFAGSALAVIPPAARAQGEHNARGTDSEVLQEIIVTTTRHEESVREVPQAVSILTGEEMAKRSIISVDDYTSFVPGLSFNRTGFGDRTGLDLTIRGISNTRLTDINGGAGALTTGFYIDDIAVQPVDVWLYDLDRLEVLKGPQGTLFGQASMGGTVRLITNKPDPSAFAASTEVTASGTQGGDPSGGVRGMVNLPLLSDILALRLVAYSDEQGGFIDWQPPSLQPGAIRGPTPGLPAGFPDPQVNSDTKKVQNVNSQTTLGMRATMRYTPTDRLTITPFYMWQSKDTAFSGFIDRNLNEGFVNERYVREPRAEQFSHAALTVDYDFPIFRVTSTTGEFKRDYRWTQDSTSFITTQYGRRPDGGIPSLGFIDSRYNTKIVSEELRLTSNSGTHFDWVLGAAYFDQKDSDASMNLAPTYNAQTPPQQHIPGGDGGVYTAALNFRHFKNSSVYADLTYKVFEERLQLSLGARRYQNEFSGTSSSEGAGVGSPGVVRTARPVSGKGNGTVPRVAVKYQFDPQRMIYVSATKGYRGGGPGAPARELETAPCLDALQKAGVEPGGSFKSDQVKSYEIGTKTSWINRRLTADLTLFRVDWADLQTSLIMNNFNVSCGTTVTANAGSAKSQGAELSLGASVTDSLYFTSAVTYTDARLGAPPPGVAVGKQGDRLQNTPEWQATLTGQYSFPILDSKFHGYIRGDLSYYGSQISQQAMQHDPFFQVPSRFVVNMRLGYSPNAGNWDAELFLNNATNEEIVYGAQAMFGEPYTNEALVGRPRTLGFLLRYHW
jgi:iron complex outermembrane recepter protein